MAAASERYEVSAFKNHEDELVDSLESADLKTLISESAEIGVLPQDVKKAFESLDAVPRPLKLRYLLMHAYASLRDKPRLFERWLKVLARHASKQVLCNVRQSHTLLLSAHKTSYETLSLADAVPHHEECRFLERHVAALTELLASDSSSSYEIGLSLNLPKNVLREIKTLILISGGMACLSEVLHQWIVGKHKHAKPPTVESLKQTLGSKIVGLGRVAHELGDQLVSIAREKDELPPLPKRPCLEAPPMEIVRQSRDTSVVEGKSTLLEVQVEASDQTNISYQISYQWQKDGLPFDDGEDFVGADKPILFLHATSLSVRGTYKCVLNASTGSVLSSDPIVVQVSVPPLKKALVDRYCAQPEIPEDSWPPHGSNTYINLALIKQRKQRRIDIAGEYARNTIQGSVDDTVADKESIEYETVFSDFESGTRLLIVGRPGSGKTTLVHKFSKDWASGIYKLKNVKLLFLVHLRAFFSNPDIKLRDMLERYYGQESMVEEVVQFADEHSGEGLCFILDGLDEYNPESRNSTFIFQLIKRERLPKAVVIVASRPAATAELREVASKQVEVIGFMKVEITEYVDQYPFLDIGKRADLHSYLDQHPNVLHMCYLPIHAAMVCYLFEVMGSCLPRTETEMYTEFTRHTLLRSLTRNDECCQQLRSLDSLQGPEKELFLKICELSFNITVASKQALESSEVSFFNDVTSGVGSLGLITVDCMASVCGFENLYTFLHLTFQEYLAAYHISKLEENEQLQVINDHGKTAHMQVVWKFYCGLVTFNQACKFEKLLSLEDDLFNVHCAFESQQSITCNSVVKSGESGSLSFYDHFLTPSDFTAIDYTLANASVENLQTLYLRHNCINVDGAEALADSLKHCPNLQTLDLWSNRIGDDGAEALAGSLKHCPNLQTLNLEYNSIGDNGAEALAGGLKHCPNLQTLNLLSNRISYDCAEALKHCPNLQALIIEENTQDWWMGVDW